MRTAERFEQIIEAKKMSVSRNHKVINIKTPRAMCKRLKQLEDFCQDNIGCLPGKPVKENVKQFFGID